MRPLMALASRPGIIPARAGFTAPASTQIIAALGSSPLARGLRGGLLRPGLTQGIIPARAGFTLARKYTGIATADHPRSRGVYRGRTTPTTGRPGSSPLARGLPGRACRSPSTSWDHPRSRGVYSSPCPTAGRRQGSSPLARGLLRGPPVADVRARIIPARAGFTSSSRSPAPASCWIIPARAGFTADHLAQRAVPTDHPRSRGVYALKRSLGSSTGGSSPLARGLRRTVVGSVPPARIIPARAGFTTTCQNQVQHTPDHPRSRGVYYISSFIIHHHLGSSPLARGLPAVRARASSRRGIIPARAGFTGGDLDGRPGPADHPRSRGGYCSTSETIREKPGSSPLARGLPLFGNPVKGLVGIIPARAGFTTTPTASPCSSADHPRSRGVYARWRFTGCGVRGSSPLARGLQ